MSRDHRKLNAFVLADSLIVEVYRGTATFPPGERFGLQAQVRRAAVSAATNIVEGSTRASTREYCRFLEVALGSAREAGYLMGVARRLQFVSDDVGTTLAAKYDELAAMLNRAVASLERCG